MIVTITGMLGSGKSTIAKMLAKELNLTHYSMGDLRGQTALEQGVTVQEFNLQSEDDPTSDNQIDEYQKKLGETSDNFIIDSRLAWHFIPHSFKLFLDVDADEAAQRIFLSSKKGERKDEPHYHSAKEVKKAVKERLDSDQKRFQTFYDLNFLDQSHYDLVIDTTSKTPREIVDLITKALPKKES